MTALTLSSNNWELNTQLVPGGWCWCLHGPLAQPQIPTIFSSHEKAMMLWVLCPEYNEAEPSLSGSPDGLLVGDLSGMQAQSNPDLFGLHTCYSYSYYFSIPANNGVATLFSTDNMPRNLLPKPAQSRSVNHWCSQTLVTPAH